MRTSGSGMRWRFLGFEGAADAIAQFFADPRESTADGVGRHVDLGRDLRSAHVLVVVEFDEFAAFFWEFLEAVAQEDDLVLIARRRVAFLDQLTDVFGQFLHRFRLLTGALAPEPEGDVAGHGGQQGAEVGREIPLLFFGHEFEKYLLSDVFHQARPRRMLQCYATNKVVVREESLGGLGFVRVHEVELVRMVPQWGQNRTIFLRGGCEINRKKLRFRQ